MTDTGMTSRDYRMMKKQLTALDKTVAVQAEAFSSLAKIIDRLISKTPGADCPHQVDIAKGANGTQKLDQMIKDVHALDLGASI